MSKSPEKVERLKREAQERKKNTKNILEAVGLVLKEEQTKRDALALKLAALEARVAEIERTQAP